MEKLNNILIYIVFLIFTGIIGYFIGNKTKNNNVTHSVIIDTIYNKVTFDSIKYNIKKKDSIIIKLKTKVVNEKSKVLNLNDSISVELFNTLAGAECK